LTARKAAALRPKSRNVRESAIDASLSTGDVRTQPTIFLDSTSEYKKPSASPAVMDVTNKTKSEVFHPRRKAAMTIPESIFLSVLGLSLTDSDSEITVNLFGRTRSLSGLTVRSVHTEVQPRDMIGRVAGLPAGCVVLVLVAVKKNLHFFVSVTFA